VPVAVAGRVARLVADARLGDGVEELGILERAAVGPAQAEDVRVIVARAGELHDVAEDDGGVVAGVGFLERDLLRVRGGSDVDDPEPFVVALERVLAPEG
jgi:hypothetical protein